MPHTPTRETRQRVLVLGYSGLLAGIAGFINSVALLVLTFPVGIEHQAGHGLSQSAAV